MVELYVDSLRLEINKLIISMSIINYKSTFAHDALNQQIYPFVAYFRYAFYCYSSTQTKINYHSI